MGGYRVTAILFILVLCLIPAVSAVHYHAAGTISTLTDRPEERWEIGISGGNVIWIGPGENYGEQILYLCNIADGKIQTIASSVYSTFHPEIEGYQVLFGEKTCSSGPVNLIRYDTRDGNLSYIDPYLSNQDFPATDSDIVAWLDSRAGGYTNIYIKKGENGKSYQFYESGTSDKHNPEISEGYVYWIEKGVLYRKNIESESLQAIISGMPTEYSISGERIVWEFDNDGLKAIALLDTGSMNAETIVESPGDQLNPDIDGDNVAWQENEDGQNIIRVKNIETGISAEIYSSAYLQSDPKISSNRIVWFDSAPGKESVRLFEMDNFAVPSADFTSDAEPSLAPLKVHFVPEITISVNTEPELFWDFGDGTFSSEVEPEHVYTEPGIYNVTLTISNEFGKITEFKPSYIIAGELPVPDFYTEITSGNVPLTIEFIDNSSGLYDSRSWNFGDGVRSILKNPVHTYNEPGLYTVSLNLSNDFGSITETKYGYIRAGFEVDLREPDSDTITTPERLSGLPNIFSNESAESGNTGSTIPSFDVQDFIGLLNNK